MALHLGSYGPAIYTFLTIQTDQPTTIQIWASALSIRCTRGVQMRLRSFWLAPTTLRQMKLKFIKLKMNREKFYLWLMVNKNVERSVLIWVFNLG